MLRIWGPHLSANVRRLEPPARASRQMLWAHGSMIVDDGIMCSKGARAGGGREGTAATASSNKLLAAGVAALSLSLSQLVSSSSPYSLANSPR